MAVFENLDIVGILGVGFVGFAFLLTLPVYFLYTRVINAPTDASTGHVFALFVFGLALLGAILIWLDGSTETAARDEERAKLARAFEGCYRDDPNKTNAVKIIGCFDDSYEALGLTEYID